METRFYFLYLLVGIGLFLFATQFGNLNISYGEFICDSNEKDSVNKCEKIPITLDTDTLNAPTDRVISKPVQMVSEFLNEFGFEVVKAVITLFVVIDPIGIVPLFASYTERMQTQDRRFQTK